MSEQENANTTRTIEDVICEKLTRETQQNALDLVAYIRKSGMGFERDEYAGDIGWFVGGVLGNRLGFMIVHGSENPSWPWALCFQDCDFCDDADTDTKETAWAHTVKCGRCHEGWEKCGHGDRMIFGKMFDNLCLSQLIFYEPNGQTLENTKKLLLLMKRRAVPGEK